MRRAGGAPLRLAALQGAAALVALVAAHGRSSSDLADAAHHGVADVAFRTLTAFMSNEGNALNNPRIEEALVKGHLATQVLAIRRLVEDSSKDRISLRTLLKDLRRHRNLFARELRLLRRRAVRLLGLAKARFVENAGIPAKGERPRSASGLHPLGGTAHSVRQAHRRRRPDKAKPRKLPPRLSPHDHGDLAQQ